MSKVERQWDKKFIEYMEMIAAHKNYAGLPIERKADGSLKWIATAKSEIGKGRKEWALKKAKELGIPNRPGVYADVMLAVHPTKWKVCQTCGSVMSIYYHYPNENFLKKLNKHFNTGFTTCDHISDIWSDLIGLGHSESSIKEFLIKQVNLNPELLESTKDEVIQALEIACRKGNKKCLGPGAMSNFPDRFDGFHTYNRCCRSSQDKGRSKENLKSYTKDRRAYEYWSDGNIHAANQFMGSSFFEGISADHIGPISLGFVHDPRYLQPMVIGDNSSKRDRLLYVDIEKIIETESRTGVYPMSWQSRTIWEHIRANYKKHPDKIETLYRDALKQNMVNYMFILLTILQRCPNNGKKFLVEAFLKPHFKCFEYSYEFNKNGDIVNKTSRHYTDRNKFEIERYVRIAIDSVYEYNDKENRNIKNDLKTVENQELYSICNRIEEAEECSEIKKQLVSLVEQIERRIISSI